MRVFFLLLLLGNAAFYAWAHYLRAPVSAQERIQQVQITPEKIRLVAAPVAGSTAASAAAPAKPTAPLVKAGACLEWGSFIGNEAARADAAIAEAGFTAGQVQRLVSDLDGQWVMIPPRKSRAEVERVSEELKGLGVKDFTVVQEPLRRNAISLGVFRTEEGAQNFLASLQKRGVAEATVEVRTAFFRRVSFVMRDPAEAMVARFVALKTAVAGTELKAVNCPVPRPPVEKAAEKAIEKAVE